MRAITHVTIRRDQENIEKPFTVFLEYNNNAHDYSFNNFETMNSALQSIPLNSEYFPLKVSDFRFLIIKGNETILDETLMLPKI